MKRYITLIFIIFTLFLSISHAENLNEVKEKLTITKQDLSNTPFKLYNRNDVSEIGNQFCHLGNQGLILILKNSHYTSAYAASVGSLNLYYCGNQENAKKFLSQQTAKLRSLTNHTIVTRTKGIPTREIYKYRKVSKDGFFYLDYLYVHQDFCSSKITDKPCIVSKKEEFSYYKTVGSYVFEISVSKSDNHKNFEKFAKIAARKLYNVILKKLSGESENNGLEVNSEDYEVVVSAESKGFQPSVSEYDLKYGFSKSGLNPSSVKEAILRGNILNSEDSNPISGADVTIKFRGKKYSIKSDNQGKYAKLLLINPNGSRSVYVDLDLYLREKPKHVVVKVLSKQFIADGRYQKLVIKLTDATGKPLKNKVYLLSYKSFTHNGKNVNYITHPTLTNTIRTNSMGVAVADILTPKVIKNRLNDITNAKKYFPIESQIILIKNSGAVGSFNIEFKSPFPEIAKILLPGGMDAEHWQNTPSRIFIKDLDSDTFNIKLMGYGRFKTRGGKIYKTVFHQYRYNGNEFEFYFASGQLGLDLNKQPQVWKAFVDTNLRVLMSTLLTLNEGTSFEAMRKIKKKWVSTVLTDKVSFERVYGGTKLAFGAREYKNSAQAFLNSKNKDRISKADMVVGGAFLTNDLVALIKKSSSTLKDNLQMELMKAIYENAKTTYGIFKKYENIVNSYKDLYKINIFVKVTDMDGYSTIITKPIFVKAWEGVK